MGDRGYTIGILLGCVLLLCAASAMTWMEINEYRHGAPSAFADAGRGRLPERPRTEPAARPEPAPVRTPSPPDPARPQPRDEPASEPESEAPSAPSPRRAPPPPRDEAEDIELL